MKGKLPTTFYFNLFSRFDLKRVTVTPAVARDYFSLKLFSDQGEDSLKVSAQSVQPFRW